VKFGIGIVYETSSGHRGSHENLLGGFVSYTKVQVN